MSKYGYARVSTADQNPQRQILALEKEGLDRIFVDRESGRNFERPQYRKLLRALRKDDCLFVTSLDRLGRNYDLIKEEWARITRRKGADIVVLDMPLLDTRQGKTIIGTFLSDIVLQLLAFVAQMERDNIRARQAEGIAAAKLRGVRFGPKPRPLPENFAENYDLWQAGEISGSEAARRAGMASSTFFHKAKLYGEQRNGNDKGKVGSPAPAP